MRAKEKRETTSRTPPHIFLSKYLFSRCRSLSGMEQKNVLARNGGHLSAPHYHAVAFATGCKTFKMRFGK